MLRASSLGLSYPLPNISALHTCRRLYGARRTWVLTSSCRLRHASSDSNNHVPGSVDTDAEAAYRPSISMTVDHRQPVQVRKPAPPHPTTGRSQSQLERELPQPQENLHVAYTQRHHRLLVLERLESEQETLEVRETFGTASIVLKDQQGEGEEKEDVERRVPHPQTRESDSPDTGGQDASLLNTEGASPTQERVKRPRADPTRTKRQAIEDAPPYAAGRPWSPRPVIHAVIPDKTTHLLRNIENGLKTAHKKYWNQKEGEEKAEAEVRRKGNPDPAVSVGKQAPAATTTVEKSSSSLETNKRLLEGENDAENMEEPPPVEIIARIRERLDILGTTDSVDAAWESYTYLIDTISCSPIIYNRLEHIPFAHLHRLVRLLAHNRPRTHLQYLRLLSVMTYIVHVGGTLKQPEWNALINHVGSGRRRTTDADVENALAALESISAGQLPGASEFGLDELPVQTSFVSDVYTMTTLLSLAARAQNPALLKQISTMMAESGIVPNRITHLSLLRYFTEKKDLPGLRRTLRKLRDQGMELGLDGVNSCIWAFGYVQKLEIVLMIYRVLRHNKFPEDIDDSDPNNVHYTISQLQEEAVFIEDNVIPNEISYTALIQVMAYNGQFLPAIRIFFDMLSTENVEQGAPLQHSESGDLVPEAYSPSVAVYRAIFLGFKRHGKNPSLVRNLDELDWTLKNLTELFERFLSMPDGTVLTHSVLDIIISAFVQTSGGDMDVVRRVWVDLDNKFGIVFHKEHSNSRLARLRKSLFPDDQLTERLSDADG